MDTKELIRLVTAVVIEVMKQIGSNPAAPGPDSTSPSGGKRTEEPVRSCRREVLTLEDVRVMVKNRQGIVIKPGDRLTSLAADYIRDNRLEVRYEAYGQDSLTGRS